MLEYEILRTLLVAFLMAFTGNHYAVAAELSGNFSQMGTIEFTADGVGMSLVVPHNKKSGRPFARLLPLGNKVTVNVAAYSPGANGLPGNPMVSLIFDLVNDNPTKLSIRYVDGMGMKYPMIARAGIGEAEFITFQRLDDDSISAEVRAQVVRVDTSASMTDPTIVEGEQPTEIELSLAVSFKIPN